MTELRNEDIQYVIDRLIKLSDSQRKELFGLIKSEEILDKYEMRQIWSILKKQLQSEQLLTVKDVKQGDCFWVYMDNAKGSTAVATHDAYQEFYQDASWCTHLLLGTGSTMVLTDEMLKNGQVLVIKTHRSIKGGLEYFYKKLTIACTI